MHGKKGTCSGQRKMGLLFLIFFPSLCPGGCLGDHVIVACTKKSEEMGRMGYTHLAIADQFMALPKKHRPSIGTEESLNFWKDVLPHVR